MNLPPGLAKCGGARISAGHLTHHGLVEVKTRIHNMLEVRLLYRKLSGEPMFNSNSRFVGYRGIGVELTSKLK